MRRRTVILPSDKSQMGRTFHEEDEVAVYNRDGKRVTGRAKWAYPVSDKDQQKYYVIGIETDVRMSYMSLLSMYVPYISV